MVYAVGMEMVKFSFCGKMGFGTILSKQNRFRITFMLA